MNIFKTACRILLKQRTYILIYVVLLGFMGVFVATGNTHGVSSDDFVQDRADVAVIDRDGSALAGGISETLAERSNMVEVDGTERALQDAVAQGTTDCLVIVPEGYGEAFVEAARAGEELPRVQTVASFDRTSGYEVENQLQMYLACAAVHVALDADGAEGDAAGVLADDAGDVLAGGVADAGSATATDAGNVAGAGDAADAGGAAASDADVADDVLAAATAAALDDMRTETAASYAVEEGEASPLPDDFLLYNRWQTYPILCAVGVLVSVTMAGFNRTDVRRRNLSAPVSSLSLSLGLAAAGVVCALITWGWLSAQGLVVFSGSLSGTEAWRVALCIADSLAFVLFALAFGFLLAQAGASEMTANAASNITGLVLSFLGGSWMDVSLMGGGMEVVARFTPSYWHGQALVNIAQADALTWEALAPAVIAMGMVLLFAAALFAVALAVGRIRLGNAGVKGAAAAKTVATV
ncbi:MULTISPECIES: ABC transporter permease [unclassified Adlercreutzia]|uniref:ABC transporter permease n=1 Tax=unclassified Adlercreutzia TaxID=2636013 RepID=UPI0013ED1070|nr:MULTISPECIES: ABC transporter permease [unclassified Adlercreutzia]